MSLRGEEWHIGVGSELLEVPDDLFVIVGVANHRYPEPVSRARGRFLSPIREKGVERSPMQPRSRQLAWLRYQREP